VSRVGMTIRQGLNSMIGFITIAQLVTTRNYSTIADLHTLQFTVTHTHIRFLSIR
jgi:hypothetical protein